MPIFFQRPENALKRANEFIDVGKKQRALDALYDVIKSKKHRQWSKTHEAIMEKYLQLCVELKKSHIAKEGLYQYKNISQQVSIKSLEDVVRKYLALAEEKTETARKESHQAVVDVDDLDVIQTPENLLLSAVSGEDTQDRTDRAILTPWVKFLWESYRQCLDLLRNDGTVEKLYQDIAQQAFKFCLKYQRKTEFRKLCDNLRTHLSHIHKHQHKQRAINLNNPESQQLHLETRLVQLESAIQMELWMEAFKAVEDIHGLIQQSKKPPKPSLMANYYQKLGLVFWKSGNHMFHACAWHRMYHLIKEQRRNLTVEDLQKYSSRVLCATLAIPIPPSRNQIDTLMALDDATQEKQRRLANLLGLKNPPTRAGLLKDLVKYGIPGQCQKELQNLYNSLEVEFHPLKLSARVEEPLKFIGENKDLKQYVPAIQDITITRLIKQISQIYQTIEFERFIKLVPFTNIFRMERVIVNTAKNLQLQVRIDHFNKSLSFGTDLGVAQKEDVAEGPYLQSMPSEQIRNQLSAISNALNKAQKVIQPVDVKQQDMQAQLCQSYKQVARKEHERILQRRIIIENRKEELENLSNRREQEEAELVENERRRQYDAEMQRLEKEAEERERQRHLQEHQEIQKKVAKERLEQLKSTQIGEKAFEGMTEDLIGKQKQIATKETRRALKKAAPDIVKMDVDDILAKQVEQLEKEKKEMQEKLKGQMKKVDHFERAKRIEEIPLLKAQFENENQQQQKFWEEQEADRIETMKTERALAVEHKTRLKRMMEDRDGFLKQLTDARMSVFKEKLSEFEKKFKEEKKKRLEERKQNRKEERRTIFYREKEEEEQRLKDEEAKRLREEEERLDLERKEKEEEEYNERIRKLEEIEERKRQREIEIEERNRKEKEERARDTGPPGGRDRGGDRDDGEWRRGDHGESGSPEKGAWKPSGSSGGWREREKQKKESWGSRDEDPPSGGGVGGGGGGSGGGGGWRDREQERGRDDRGPSRDDDRGPPPHRGDDDRGPKRDDDREPPRRDLGRRDDDRGPRGGDDREPSDWRRGGDDRDGPDRRDDRGPRRDDREWRRDDRGPAAPDRDDWRGGEKRGVGLDRRDERGGGGGGRWERDGGEERRDDRRGGEEGSWRGGGGGGGGARDERGGGGGGGGSSWRDREREKGGDVGVREAPAWRRGGDDRGPPPRDRDDRGPSLRDRDERKPPPRDIDDRGPPPRDRDDRGPPPRDRDERKPPPRDIDDRGPPPRDRDDRGPPPRDRDEPRSPPRDSDDRGPSSRDRPAPAWRRSGEEKERDGGDWRKDAPRREESDRPPPRSEDRGPARREDGEDGWVTVKR